MTSVASLWGEAFTLPETPKAAKKIIEKIAKPKTPKVTVEKAVKSKAIDLDEKLQIIAENVKGILGRFAENTEVIRSRERLHSYIDSAIKNGAIAIDTETNNSLDPITCTLMGPCLYTPGEKQAYIPLHHVNWRTNELLPDQLTEADIHEELSRLSGVLIVMHNGKFDYQVIKCTTGTRLNVYWDTMIGARILNENELAGLKYQYRTKIDPTIDKYDIEHLFTNIQYAYVHPEIFALYAAGDAYETYRLYEFQKKLFELEENSKLYYVFKNIEMPMVEVTAEMELTGVVLDKDYAKRLSDFYHKQLEDVDSRIAECMKQYEPRINAWKQTPEATKAIIGKTGKEGKSKAEQIETPLNTASPTQLAIFLYDILQVQSPDKKSPRGTGEAILEAINEPICSLILEKRGLMKLLSTYIDALPAQVNEKTGRLHAHFNQIGADTGRLSSSSPNLQNVPSQCKSIRLMFKPSDGNVFVGADFSQQEPRLLANYAQDENMLNAYRNKKDLYATIASGVYHNGYWDNMEHKEDGTANPEGKERRSNCKSLLLGLMYGRGTASIAEQIHGSIEDAQKITDDFFNGFPNVKKWIDKTTSDAHKTGYVEDLWGRRRRLPDILLPKYEVKLLNEETSFNPIIGAEGKFSPSNSPLLKRYSADVQKCRGKRDYESLQQKALNDGISIKDNSGFIAQAERQCVNARVQGGAASMSKRAMINIYKDKELNELGFKLNLTVHDEVIGECPKENAEKVAARLSDVMIHAAEPECNCPFKCDAVIVSRWYIDDYSDMITSQYNELVNKAGKTSEEAKTIIMKENPMIQEKYLDEMMQGTYDCTAYMDI